MTIARAFRVPGLEQQEFCENRRILVHVSAAYGIMVTDRPTPYRRRDVKRVYRWNCYDAVNCKDDWFLCRWNGCSSSSTTMGIPLTAEDDAMLEEMPSVQLWNDWYMDNEHRAIEISTANLLPF